MTTTRADTAKLEQAPRQVEKDFTQLNGPIEKQAIKFKTQFCRL